jgi:hypothetical protein
MIGWLGLWDAVDHNYGVFARTARVIERIDGRRSMAVEQFADKHRAASSHPTGALTPSPSGVGPGARALDAGRGRVVGCAMERVGPFA